MANPQGAVVVLVHDEADVIDLLRGLFEAHGLAVDCVSTMNAAVRRLAGFRADVIVVPYDRDLGKLVTRWTREHAADLRRRLLFVTDEIPPRLEDAASRKRIVRLDDLPGLLEAADRIASGVAQPRLLLVEDDPSQREEMAELLGLAGFRVTSAKGGDAAAALLETNAFAVVLSDWMMEEGSGADLHRWVSSKRPDLLRTLVFMTGGDPREARASVDVPVMPKGQDSLQLLAQLRRAMGPPPPALGTPPRGTPALRRKPPTRPR